MTNHHPFFGQKLLVEITEADIESFNAERFRFAQAVHAHSDAVREAAVALLESAIFAQALPVQSAAMASKRQSGGTSEEEVIW